MKTNIKVNLLSTIVAFAASLAASFLYAVVLKDCWNWFLVPVTPVATLGFAAAYGVCVAILVIVTLFSKPIEEDSKVKEDYPILDPILRMVAKVIVVLIFWAFAAIAHCAIG